jgi:hypothetical protein
MIRKMGRSIDHGNAARMGNKAPADKPDDKQMSRVRRSSIR